MNLPRRHLLASVASLATGEMSMARAAARRPVTVVGTTFARLYEPGPDGQPQGLAVDLLDAILLPAGLSPRYELLPWARAQTMIELGGADVLVGPYRTAEREKRMRFSREGFAEDALVFYARRREQGLWWGDFDALKALRIGTVQGWTYGERFEQARARLRLSVVRDLPAALRMLELRRLDLVAANQRNSEPVIEALQLTSRVQLCLPPFGHLRAHFAFRLDEGAPLQALVDSGLQRLRASGQLLQLTLRRGVSPPE